MLIQSPESHPGLEDQAISLLSSAPRPLHTPAMRILNSLLIAATLPLSAFAGTAINSPEDVSKSAPQPVTCATDPLNTIIATTDYGFHQDMERGNGNIEVEHNNFEIDRRIPLDFLSWPNVQCGQWFLRLGADYERFDFSIHDETRLPDTLQSAAGIIGLEYLVNDKTAILIETRPGVYFQERANSGAFDSPTNLAVVIPVHDDTFYIIGGVTVSALAEYPVFPIGGILWHINDKWDLRAYLPDPRLVYQCSDNLEFFAGGELVGGAYKTDNRVLSPEKLSGGAVITYDEARVGAGITWKAKPLTLEFAAGYTVQSQFDYSRADETFSAHPAPYVRLTARLDF